MKFSLYLTFLNNMSVRNQIPPLGEEVNKVMQFQTMIPYSY